ncbi:MAG: thiamine-phosphate kinase [Candidatus Omnitrophica bacterium]|nr:thiamine-phosphate kinase [Candidatus Omnitrophota bacterium]MDD5487637.1 thiamine-phosphate kinase [Candidatus Omnitrophota bacterium]
MKELAFIERIRSRAGRPPRGIRAGIGDDCAVIEGHDGKYILWAADMLVDGTHFRLRECGYGKAGRKAVAVNLSDIAAMGGIPKYVLVSLGIPRGTTARSLDLLYDGILDMCKEYGVIVLGGDTNRAGRLVIDVSILGEVEKERLTLRSGARKGDVVMITGPVRNGRRTHLDFIPRVKEARAITSVCGVTAMIDTSDGIAMDMGRICAESGVGVVLDGKDIPLSAGLDLADALYYGESFELLFTVPENDAARLEAGKKGKYGNCRVFRIGRVVAKKEGMRVKDDKGGFSPLAMEGYRHI